VSGPVADRVDRPLRFGVLPTVAPYFAPRFLATLAALNADANVDFVEDRTDPLELAVNADTLDFAVTATLPRVQNLSAIPLVDERLVAVSGKPLPATTRVDDLAGPILLMQEGHCFRDVVSEAIRRAHARTRASVSTRIGPSSFATLVSLVRSGLGDTLLPEPFVRESPMALAGLSTAILEPAGEGRQLQLIVRRGRERYRDVRRLAEAATEALAPHPAAQAAKAAAAAGAAGTRG